MKKALITAALLLAGCTGTSEQQVEGQTAAAPEASADEKIFATTIERARQERLDTLPMGEIVAQVGTWFVGTPYVPHTLEAPGPEQLVVNLREFDCVTYVESMLALARVIRSGGNSFDDFTNELRKIRYRQGRLDSYPSRLHYFSDWIYDNDATGIVRDYTRQLGGVVDPEPLNFMTQHRESYRQLADSANFHALLAQEAELNKRQRYVIPENRIAAAASGIKNGDVIAATTNVAGLDVAHTGLAIWQDGTLRLMHAPLVGDSVMISGETLAERIIRIERQDGIMVARPLDPVTRD